MPDPLILAIDVGTQSTRATLFDAAGGLVGLARSQNPPWRVEHPGWAELDPEEYWSRIGSVCRTLWRENPAADGAVRAVALTTQRASVVNLDAAGKPLRPAILWPDQRRTEGLPLPGGVVGLGLATAGLAPTVAYFQAEAEANWLHVHQPELLRRTKTYTLLSGYLAFRLTGRLVDSTACQVGYLPFDFRRSRWAAPRSWKWRALPGLRRDQMIELVSPGSELGRITDAAAADTGIPAGLPLIAAAADKACEALGAGCLAPETAALSYGTTATVSITSDKYLEATRFVPPFPSAVPGKYSVEIQIYRGYWLVSWFKDQFGHFERQLAAERGVEPETLFDDLLAEVPPGSLGLVAQPYWSPPLRSPGPEARGAILGFGDVHTRAHVYRALLEGIAYALREGATRLQKRSGRRITAIRVAGGGSRSDAAMQLTADIFGLPTIRPHVYETSALGAAIVAAAGAGIHDDFTAAVRAMTHDGALFEPDPQARRLYDKLYRRVYLKMYRRLQPLYRAAREITGYPP